MYTISLQFPDVQINTAMNGSLFNAIFRQTVEDYGFPIHRL